MIIVKDGLVRQAVNSPFTFNKERETSFSFELAVCEFFGGCYISFQFVFYWLKVSQGRVVTALARTYELTEKKIY